MKTELSFEQKLAWLCRQDYVVIPNGNNSEVYDPLDENGYRLTGPYREIVEEAYEFLMGHTEVGQD